MIHDRSTFENSCAGQPPWDIGKPQKPFIDVADRITGSVLDAGCGTGGRRCSSPGGAARPRASTSSRKRSTGPAAWQPGEACRSHSWSKTPRP
jgi:hypothetical protein